MNEKNGVSVAHRIEPSVNRYYLKVSRRYMIIGMIFIALFILYAVCIAMFFGEYVTYDNLKYLARDWSTMTVPGNGVITDIVYSASDSAEFKSFRSGFALYDSDSYSYYDESGICLVEDKHGCVTPDAETSQKYLLLYDIGGKSYSVYNQLTQIIRRETGYAIIAGDIADDGSMVIVTRSRETRFVVEVYNAAFTKIMNIYKENYVIDAAVSNDGDTIIICSAVPSDSDFNMEVEICKSGSSEKISQTTYEHVMPLDVMTHENGFVILCDSGLYFFDYDGSIISSVDFGGMTLKYADMNEKSVAIVGQINALGTENRVVVCDISGEVLYDRVIEDRIRDIYATENAKDALAYMRLSEYVAKLHPDGTMTMHESENGKILSVVPRKNGALICRESGAYMWE